MAKTDALLVTEAEVARRLGLPAAEWERAAKAYQKAGMPLPCPITHRLYWPAVRAFLDRHYGLAPIRPGMLGPATRTDGEENPDALRNSKSRRARA
jgi:hypothetical protein